MNFFLIWFLALFSAVFAADSSSSSSSSSTSSSSTQSPTMIWVTGTDADGKLATTESPFSQSQFVENTSTTSVSSGSVGMGSISGEVGKVTTYSQVTITAGGSFAYGSLPGPLRSNMPWKTVIAVGTFVLGVAFI
ncbi:uncharacterized protein CXQ87_004212 [Candidozyma duobushaemuli]|uniref:Protein KRE1 n=1 Tax=Candidozyma duobushaemuli TaxID=1231522 RepID=A0A2V1AEI0_9ASCO|nr:uncharacterized protein CXQ87_004212 [[Candida] duobushaemulonis]PVH16338.1 hypothetical protein CXQ87_004212 [[Candida] duobushaemulonis]